MPSTAHGGGSDSGPEAKAESRLPWQERREAAAEALTATSTTRGQSLSCTCIPEEETPEEGPTGSVHGHGRPEPCLFCCVPEMPMGG